MDIQEQYILALSDLKRLRNTLFILEYDDIVYGALETIREKISDDYADYLTHRE